MTRKLSLILFWLGFIGYAFFLAPPLPPGTFELIKRLSTGQIAGINPLIVALFNLLGVFPLIYACLLLIDGRMQKLPAWIFMLGSFGTGAFALLPYLALRDPNPHFTGEKSALLKLLDSRWFGGSLAITAIGLVVYGITQGNWADFSQQWQTNRFIHVMSLDFCVLCLLFPTLLGDDMSRRQLHDRRIFWAVSLLPLLGAALYVALRPPLPSPTTTESSPQQPAALS
ncbi:DUF2834 domain-containing protein [Pantanalinema rosaneae CENA516]|uniref:DUF2834 domain-containing protein n=1 Tax=Pantanalinema rosaneae TaxID=1620701 RepID=UPI003D6EBF25